MPRNVNMITYGKVTIASDSALDYVKGMLDAILKEHGYPEAGLMNKEDIAEAEADFKRELTKLDDKSSPSVELGRQERDMRQDRSAVAGRQEVPDGRAPPYKVQQPGRKQQPVKSEVMY